MRKMWERWKTLMERVGDIQATIILSVLYFILFLPLGLIVQHFTDFLNRKSAPGWQRVKDSTSNKMLMKRQ